MLVSLYPQKEVYHKYHRESVLWTCVGFQALHCVDNFSKFYACLNMTSVNYKTKKLFLKTILKISK